MHTTAIINHHQTSKYFRDACVLSSFLHLQASKGTHPGGIATNFNKKMHPAERITIRIRKPSTHKLSTSGLPATTCCRCPSPQPPRKHGNPQSGNASTYRSNCPTMQPLLPHGNPKFRSTDPPPASSSTGEHPRWLQHQPSVNLHYVL